WLFWIGICNSMWGAEKKAPDLKIVGMLSGVSLLVMLVMASNPSLVSAATIRLLGLGNKHHVVLMTTKEGCFALRNITDQSICTALEDSNLYKTKPVNLLSRIGAQYLISTCS